MDTDKQLIVKYKGRVCTMIINRSDKRNTLNPVVLQAMSDTIDQLDKQEEIRVVIIRGAGEKAFCAGFDITAIPTGTGEQVAGGGQNLLEIAFDRLRNFKFPVIAMINGHCVGAGLDLTTNCDFRIAVEGSRLGITPAKLGVAYHPAGLNRFIQLIGVAATKHLFYTGRLIPAFSALEMGLIDQVVPQEKLEEAVNNLAEEIAENAPLSVVSSKYSINKLSEKINLTAEEEEEIRKMTIKAFNSEDLREGQMAFLQKRKPQFKGR